MQVGTRAARAGATLRRDQQVHGRHGGRQVAVEQPGHRATALGQRIRLEAEPGGIGAQQVVLAVPGDPDGFDEMRADEHVQQPPGLVEVGTQQGRCGVGVQIRAGMQAEQPEEGRRRGRQPVVRPGQHGTECGALVGTRIQPLQPALLVAQLGDQVREAGRRPGHRQLGRDP
ncbi:MAG: hypothetical protein AUI14_18550 [Actinobacteria bacterium 13_2_20CM_2_71_6]|nr:MAG: hypothetical protein AUI14_18550 [Actinobacteria bacterium 13_2_20CM_2_71_6]